LQRDPLYSNQEMKEYAYIPGTAANPTEPLSRFLSPIPNGIVERWLRQQNRPDIDSRWIIDPFGVSPRLTVAAAREGWRVLVTAHNPVMRFLLEMTANPPSENEFQAAMAELASSSKGQERMEPHLRNLYTVNCRGCSTKVEVEAFLWERGAQTPYGAIYTCTDCNISGEQPLNPYEAEKASAFASSGLHHSRALERVATADDPDRVHAEEALAVYLPRAVYVLFTMINKLDGLAISETRKMALQALLLSACDQANTLWAYPTQRERPRQLTTPPRFKENNIWRVMETAMKAWQSSLAPVTLSIWPELPPEEGGICLFEGPLRELSSRLHQQNSQKLEFTAGLAAIPRPNQAFWTLSALWSGWLWGKEAVAPFKSVLRRRRYDWSWHHIALQAAFENLAHLLKDGTPLLALSGEAEAGLLTAALSAAENSGFHLDGITLNAEQAQIHMLRQTQEKPAIGVDAGKFVSQAIQAFLTKNGQPASFLHVWAAGLAGLAESGVLSTANTDKADEQAAENFTFTNSLIRDVLTYRGGLLRFGSGDALETSQWWLRDEPKKSLEHEHPLADRLEIAVVKYLIKNPGCTLNEIESMLLPEFPGLLTPEIEWIQVICESYAVQESPDSRRWKVRTEDDPASRRSELVSVNQQLDSLANILGYTQHGSYPLVWKDKFGLDCYWFYPIASAVFANILLGKSDTQASTPLKSLIVIPGGRANLVAYKLKRDPRLKRLTQPSESQSNVEESQPTGWRFLKWRHLRWLVDNVSQIQQPLDVLLQQDPLTLDTQQMRLL
jgi:hypothetical protein